MKQQQQAKLVIGIVLMVSFLAVLVAIFLPLFGGDNALNALDNLYNSISKGSAYYVPKVLQQIESHPATAVSLSLDYKQAEVGARAAALLEKAGATVAGGGTEIQVQGDLPSILKACAADADSAYHGRGAEIEARYGLAAEPALHAWWSTLSAIERDLTKQKLFADARLVHSVQTKAVECAYNYYGIEASKISDRWGIVLLSLAFYVLYTVWYGYAILYLFEGLGMRLSH
jgi:hypothetical protein